MNEKMVAFQRIVSDNALGRVILCLCAVLFSLPFAYENTYVFGWIGLVILFCNISCYRKTLKRVFCSLFCFFITFYVCLYSWFVSLYPLDFAGLGNAESVGVIIIAMTAIPLIHTAIMSLSLLASHIAAGWTDNGIVRVVLYSAGYVLGEYFQSVGTLRFPWGRLFVSQTARLEILQSASLFGSYFVTFVMVLVNGLLALFVMSLVKRQRKALVYLLAALLIFGANLTYGMLRMNEADETSEKIGALVLQGNVPSSEKWSDSVSHEEIYIELSKEAAKALEQNGIDADIAVMCETAFPTTLVKDYVTPYYAKDTLRAVEIMTRNLDSELLVGAFYEESGKSYNSVYHVKRDGSISLPVYSKQNLVPFGEFLPYRNALSWLFPFMSEINILGEDIESGRGELLSETESGKIACLVCFDSIFPETARKQVKQGARLIAVSTNDSWYKTSNALYVHAKHSQMRAIENNVSVLRSANTGISQIIDPKGRVVCSTKVNERAVISANVDITQKVTLYTKIGDVPVVMSFLLIAGCLVLLIVKQKIASRKRDD